MTRRARAARGADAGPGPVLVTGGAGFIGTNLAARLLAGGESVRVLDSLVRPGAQENLAWLQAHHGERLEVMVADVRDGAALDHAVAGTSWVVHLAAQVAVTSSLADPRRDFEVNAVGTFNLLEALRRRPDPPPLLFTSSNKVYGPLEDLALTDGALRCEPACPASDGAAVDEARPLDLHSPYACSKGSAELYALDYARCFGLRVVVFRMSCIYGTHQHGNEDQGWVAHFLLSALRGEPITLYGDGRQVRDVLYVDDLVDAMRQARTLACASGGRAFNIGGGPANTLSLLELVACIRERGFEPPLRREPARVGDQRYYVSDPSRFRAATGWRPTIAPREGVARLLDWLRSRQSAPARRRSFSRAAASGVAAS